MTPFELHRSHRSAGSCMTCNGYDSNEPKPVWSFRLSMFQARLCTRCLENFLREADCALRPVPEPTGRRYTNVQELIQGENLGPAVQAAYTKLNQENT